MTMRDMHDRTPWWVKLLLPILLSTGISVFAAYNHNDKVVSNEITTLKTQRVSDKEKIDHIGDQVDKIYDKLLEWERAK